MGDIKINLELNLAKHSLKISNRIFKQCHAGT